MLLRVSRATAFLIRSSKTTIYSIQRRSFTAPNTLRTSQVKTPLLSRQIAPPLLRLQIYNQRFYADKQHDVAKVSPKHPDVSTSSSTLPITSEVGDTTSPKTAAAAILAGPPDINMTRALKGDLKAIKETFALNTVPREAYYFGLAGVLPYASTSLATIYCAWELNHIAAHGTGAWLVSSSQDAHALLAQLEPLQVGYGAVLLSFLGAIHWGLELAGFGGHHTYRRYGIGVLAALLAWPTVLMPYEWALASQFLAFTVMYSVDAAVTRRGWTPGWYSTYRFVLTFLVGASIVLSLVGRGEIADDRHMRKFPKAGERILEGERRGDAQRNEMESVKATAYDEAAAKKKKKSRES